MAKWNRRLGRIAVRLYVIYAALADDAPPCSLPDSTWSNAQTSLRRWQTALDRGWLAAAERQRKSLVWELESLERRVGNLASAVEAETRPAKPTLKTLYEELAAADAEFGGLAWEANEIAVTTEPVVLDDIELGPFRIHLHVERLGVEMPYRIEALEPNPAASNSEVTHPHVSSERLCVGEGRAAVAAALAEGRLFDFFTIVDRILHTYALGSAYVEMNHWCGVPCHDCGSTTDDDDVGTCERCEEQVCTDCLGHCSSCGNAFCTSCLERCPDCDDFLCSGCLDVCSGCRRPVCSSCLEENLCRSCHEELEDLNAREDQDEVEASDTQVATPQPTV